MTATCALKSTGAVVCWGVNNFGQVGNGNLYEQSRPVQVVGLDAGVGAISGGEFHSCALKSTGAVLCWGKNLGRIGDGTNDARSVPTQVVGLETETVAVSAGGSHTCAVNATGAVVCWGANGSGQLGDGTQISKPVPAAVRGLESGVSAVAAGFGHTCAVKSTGAVVCWGDNQRGQLGDGTNIRRTRPVAVVGTL